LIELIHFINSNLSVGSLDLSEVYALLRGTGHSL